MTITSSLPIAERIATEIFERLQFLLAGYDPLTPVVEVVRPVRFGGFTPKHMQIVLTQESPERNPELDCVGNPPAIAYDTVFNIRCHVLPSESDTTPIDYYLHAMAANVKRVVQDESLIQSAWPWHTMGNLAINSVWETEEHIDADGGIDGVNVQLRVTYRTDENNPFNKR